MVVVVVVVGVGEVPYVGVLGRVHCRMRFGEDASQGGGKNKFVRR